MFLNIGVEYYAHWSITKFARLEFTYTPVTMDRIQVTRFSFRRKGSARKDKERQEEPPFDLEQLTYLR